MDTHSRSPLNIYIFFNCTREMSTPPREPLPDIPTEGEEILESRTVENSNNCTIMSATSSFNERTASMTFPASSTACNSSGLAGDNSNPNGSPISTTSSSVQVISKRNWKLWSVWNPKLVAFPLFQSCLDGVNSVACGKGSLEGLVNSVFESYFHDEEYDQLRMGDFEVFLITKDKVEEGYNRDSESLEMEAREVNFQFNQEKAVFSRYPVYLRSFAGLAEILRGIIAPSDILIISGGFHLTFDYVRYELNWDENHPTQIIRISQNASRTDISLSEKIIPSPQWKRFEFQYKVQKAEMKRTVIRHKFYIHKQFCRNVTDTLAYTQSSWDFPMPLICGVDPAAIYEFLLSPNFKMPMELVGSPPTLPILETSPRSSSGESQETEVVDPDSSYFTASPDSSSERTRDEERKRRTDKYMQIFKVNPPEDFESSTSSVDSQIEEVSTTQNRQPQNSKLHLYGIPSGGRKEDPPPACTKQQNGHCFCICSYLVWVMALTFMFFLIIGISALYMVSTRLDACPVKPEMTTSAEITSNNNYNLFGFLQEEEELEQESLRYQHLFKDNAWVRENWGRIKGWMSYFMKWINENCSLECVVAKFGIWIDFLQIY
ncbi:hypothetical protein Ocin01_02905 [Orchesella cincta]|uniref:Uncharacterized protein n=1 Tax=Orchesella cincta TaxID=48709 RepID=A0A1D2NEV3_ORCCI|nr:hypothetical protein Ocin01_02905 [Orchesella cincta]